MQRVDWAATIDPRAMRQPGATPKALHQQLAVA
jgi:hypothetical protein